MAGIQALQQSSQDAFSRRARHSDASAPSSRTFHLSEAPGYCPQYDLLLDQDDTKAGRMGVGGSSRTIRLVERDRTEHGEFGMAGWIHGRSGKRRGENREYEGFEKD